MRVFVTGASGWIGSAVVPELLAAGHEVTGLARSDASAAALEAAGAATVRGSLTDLDVLRAAAADGDGVVHLAFDHDLAFTGDFPGAIDADTAAITTIGDVLAGSDRPFVIASGLLGLKPGELATEHDGLDSPADSPAAGRHANAQLTLSYATRGVRSSVVRLPPTVHGAGDDGFVATLVRAAREKGVSGYVGDGSGRWPAVHRSDAATLFRLALERAPAGSALHAVGEQGVATKEIAAAIGRRLGLPTASVAPDDAAAHFGWIGPFFGLDAPSSGEITEQLLDWTATGPGLVEDVDAGCYG